MIKNDFVFELVLEPSEEGGFVVRCPQLQEVVTQGETIEEAIAMGREAVEAYMGFMEKKNIPLPSSMIRNTAGRTRHRNRIRVQFEPV